MKTKGIIVVAVFVSLALYCTEEKSVDAAPERQPLGYIGSPDDGYGDVGNNIGELYYEASSILSQKAFPDDTFHPKKLWASYYTSWCEGVKGPGIGEWIKINLLEDGLRKQCPKESHAPACQNFMHELTRIRIMNGFTKTENLYYANNRVKKLLVEFSGGEKMTIEVRDDRNLKYKGKYPAPQVFHVNRIQAKWVKFTILEVYKGYKYDDTCLSELSLGHDDGGWERPEGSYSLISERESFIEILKNRYGALTNKQIKFIRLNIVKETGSYAMDQIKQEWKKGFDNYGNTPAVLRRICEINRSIDLPPCLHPEWIGEEKE